MFHTLNRIRAVFLNYELLCNLAAKEMRVRYKHPILGFLWALIVPLCVVFVFKVVFSLILKVSFTEYPFFIFLATAVFPWNFFSKSISDSTLSIQENSNLIKKVYFHREIIPISIVLANLINFILSILVLMAIFIFLKVKFSQFIVLLPLVILLQSIFTIAVSLFSSGLQAKFRDIKYIVELFLLFFFYFTPVVYPPEIIANISKTLFRIYMLNPMAQIITLYRVTLLKGYLDTMPSGFGLFYLLSASVTFSLILLILGFVIFKKIEPSFSDLI